VRIRGENGKVVPMSRHGPSESMKHDILTRVGFKLIRDILLTIIGNWRIYGHIIEETWGILNNFQNWKLHHVRRNLNCAAYQLAREALSLREAHCSLEKIPLCIADIIAIKRCI
jgi:hypothetical protein